MYVMRGKLESVYKGNTAFSRSSITLQGLKLLWEWKFLPSFPMKFNYTYSSQQVLSMPDFKILCQKTIMKENAYKCLETLRIHWYRRGHRTLVVIF